MAAKPRTPRTGTAKSGSARTGGGKPATARPGAAKSSNAGPAAAKPGAASSGTAKSGTAKGTAAGPGTVEVSFMLPADVQAGRVALCGEFTGWRADKITLERDGTGSWRATVALAPGRSYRYRYLLDGERWENAWQADGYIPNPFGSEDSVILVG